MASGQECGQTMADRPVSSVKEEQDVRQPLPVWADPGYADESLECALRTLAAILADIAREDVSSGAAAVIPDDIEAKRQSPRSPMASGRQSVRS